LAVSSLQLNFEPSELEVPLQITTVKIEGA